MAPIDSKTLDSRRGLGITLQVPVVTSTSDRRRMPAGQANENV